MHDAFQVIPFQHAEDGNVIKAVQEFRAELPARFFQNLSLHGGVVRVVGGHGPEAHGALPLGGGGPHVGGQDDDGVAEVDLASQGVRHASFFQNLEKQVHDVRMGLFHFIKEDDGVGPAPDGFRELAAFVMAYVAGRRTDETGRGVFFHVLAHVHLNQGVRGAEHDFRQIAGQIGFAHAGGAQEEE